MYQSFEMWQSLSHESRLRRQGLARCESRVSGRWVTFSARSCISEFRHATAKRAAKRAVMSRVVSRMQQRLASSAFDTWNAVTTAERDRFVLSQRLHQEILTVKGQVTERVRRKRCLSASLVSWAFSTIGSCLVCRNRKFDSLTLSSSPTHYPARSTGARDSTGATRSKGRDSCGPDSLALSGFLGRAEVVSQRIMKEETHLI